MNYNHRMSYLVPFTLALKPGEKAPPPAFFEPDEPGIPTGSYELLELYCPNPECPGLDPYDDPVPYAQALFKDIAQDLNSNPAYLSRLRAHYDQVKAVAADPSHPAHSTMIKWAITGGPKPPANKRKRKRH